MTRFCSVWLLFLSLSSFAQQGRPLQKLSDRVYAYAGIKNASPAVNSFGANCGFIVGDDTVMVVDTLMSAKEASRLYADLRKVTDKPVRYVVNTHYHLDHSWGNSFFVRQGAVVIGQDNVQSKVLDQEALQSRMKRFGLTPEAMEGTVLMKPTVFFADKLTIDLGGISVRLVYSGPAHTDDSIVVLVPTEKVCFAGDILFTGYHPNLSEGDLPNWDKILAGLEASQAHVFVPGHGPLSSISDIQDLRSYLKTFDSLARKFCTGKGQEDAPSIARELLAALPAQNRTELIAVVESNLRQKYLPLPR